MELGNLIFGNSRGEVPYPDRSSFQEVFTELLNAVFIMREYYWGDCTCGFDEKDAEFWETNPCDSAIKDWYAKNDHKPDCKWALPNFVYKPTDFQIQWYKYPLRGSYFNRNITLDEFKKMIDHCVASVGG